MNPNSSPHADYRRRRRLVVLISANAIQAAPATDDPAGPCGAVNDSMTITIAPLEPVTITSISGSTLAYTGGAGSQFVLLKSADVAATLSGWSREATNTVTGGAFTIPAVGSGTPVFYSIKSE